jgi:tetratricopeptide (TPR) repeat protein
MMPRQFQKNSWDFRCIRVRPRCAVTLVACFLLARDFRPSHSRGMKTLRLFFLGLFLMFYALPLTAGQDESATIVRAAALNDRGEFRASILLLEPLVRSDARALARNEAGVAWTLLGNAYQYLGEYQKARGSFEAGIRFLKDSPEQARQYASALDNLGSLELEDGQTESAKVLRLKVKHLYETMGDHMGIARTASNLSLIALQQERYKDARAFLAEAFDEVGRVAVPNTDDMAAMYAIQGVIAAHDLGARSALEPLQHAIDLWERRHGPGYFQLGTAYLIRGQVYDTLGEYQQAKTDLRNALARLEQTTGTNSPLYLRAEISYARVLRDSGSKREAAQLEAKAAAALGQLHLRECTGCSVSALGLR